MVFLIQNMQNREKLNELLRGVEGARTGLVQLNHMTDKELEVIGSLDCGTSTHR
jgi:low affinity Fe/Cu permease